MPMPPPPARAQTIKQAKASYKARGRPSISEADKKRLERAAELERRAWRLQETEKRKAEAVKKRSEKERKDREEQAKAPLGSQRRIDRFGYKSSQMHLGAFLRKPTVRTEEQKENTASQILEDVDEFGNLEVDDDTLLNTLDGTMDRKANCHSAQLRNTSPFVTAHSLLPSPNATRVHRPVFVAPKIESFDDFFDGLGSSTQIARELDEEQPANLLSRPVPQRLVASPSSLDANDFDLTVEDIEELDSRPIRASKPEDRILMPPPPLPVRKASSSAPFMEFGFSLSQLEHFIDDDLQLTQVMRG